MWYIVGHGARSIKARYNNKHGQHSKNTPRRTHIRFRIRFRIHFCSFPSAPSTKFTNKANAPLPADGEAAREREEGERAGEREAEKNRIKLKCKTISASHLVPSKSKLFSCQRHARVNMRPSPPPLPPSLPSSPSAQRELALLIPVFCDQHWIL